MRSRNYFPLAGMTGFVILITFALAEPAFACAEPVVEEGCCHCLLGVDAETAVDNRHSSCDSSGCMCVSSGFPCGSGSLDCGDMKGGAVFAVLDRAAIFSPSFLSSAAVGQESAAAVRQAAVAARRSSFDDRLWPRPSRILASGMLRARHGRHR